MLDIGTSAPVDARSAAETQQPAAVELPPEAGVILLRIARSAVAATVSGRVRSLGLRNLLGSQPPGILLAPAAAFVTLREDGELRGCVGSLATDQPLWQAVASAAASAAMDDPRFLPIDSSEVPSLTIDVSVLGPPVPLRDPATFRPGAHGVIVERDGRRGLLLPEVATDRGWGLDGMLDATCRKAGLPRDAWRDPTTRVRVFRTARVSEAGTTDR